MPTDARLSGHASGDVSSGHRARVVFVLFAALFCATGLLYSYLGAGETLRYPDERDYLDLAAHLAALDGYTFDGETPSAHRPPGYPLVLAPLAALTSSVHAVRLVQFALLVLAAHLLASLLVRTDALSRWGGSALLLLGVVAYPVLVYTAALVFPQTVILAALTITVVLLQREGNSTALAALIGALCAFTALISPTALTLVPVALAFALWSPAWSLSRVALMALVAALVFGGWLARNVVVLDEPILFSKNLAENLDNAVLTLEPLEPGEERAPAGVVDYGLERLAQYASEPLVYLERIGDFFAHRNVLAVSEEASGTRELIMFVTYNALLLLVLGRLLLAVRTPLSRAEWLVLALYVATALFHALVIPRIRYRLPFDFLLLLPAANALLIAASRVRFRGTAVAGSG